MPGFQHLRVLLLIAIMYTQGTAAQSIKIDSLVKKFEKYRQQNLQEKVYVHLDRPSYVAGETMWFKIYLTDATLHKPLNISSVAYVELLDRNNNSLVQAKIKLDKGTGNGSFHIPTTLNSDNYTFRAYTSWMKNFDPDLFFNKTVSVINPFKSSGIQKSTNEEYWDAQFFPEGGNLVTGIESKVAFRVIKPDGKGVDFDGFIVNQHGDTIVRFKPFRFGIGHFIFTPQPDQLYQAILMDPSKKIQSVSLPNVLPKGFAMRVMDSLNQIHVSVKANLAGTSVTPAVYIFVHTRNIISAASFQVLKKETATFSLNLEELAEGISHITVLDADMAPVCERLYFKRPNTLTVDLTLDQKQYDFRSLVKVDLRTAVDQLPIGSNLSFTAFRTDSLSVSNGNMVNYFWLTSDLKGDIESPEFYFSPDEEAKIAVDNLMLTHGWRRFKWANLIQGGRSEFKFLPEVNGHIIRAQIKSPVRPTVFLTAIEKKIHVYPAKSDQNGDIFFEMKNFKGLSKIVLQTNVKDDSTQQYSIESPFSHQITSNRLAFLEMKETIASSLLDRSVALQVHNIFTANTLEEKHIDLDTIPFYGKADETYWLDAYTRFPLMEEVMREYVPGVLVRKRRDGFHFTVVDDENRALFTESPLILLDGVPIFDEDDIMSFSPLEVKKLEVVKRKWHLGPATFSGIVSFSTYKGDLGSFNLNPHSITLDYEGLQQEREFYSPRYENQLQRESRMPDQRHVLMWRPSISIGDTGNTQIEFYTCDVPGEYRIIVEGMTKTGKIGSSTAVFTVR